MASVAIEVWNALSSRSHQHTSLVDITTVFIVVESYLEIETANRSRHTQYLLSDLVPFPGKLSFETWLHLFASTARKLRSTRVDVSGWRVFHRACVSQQHSWPVSRYQIAELLLASRW